MSFLCRDLAPHALWVRSGDVMVMGGPARSCYHGVPRILPERGVPPHLDPTLVTEDFRPFARHLAESRINISVRSTRTAEPPELPHS